MAWYSNLFQQLFKSQLGGKILKAIFEAAENGKIKEAFLCDLSIRSLERTILSSDNNNELRQAISLVISSLKRIGFELTPDDVVELNSILYSNGVR